MATIVYEDTGDIMAVKEYLHHESLATTILYIAEYAVSAESRTGCCGSIGQHRKKSGAIMKITGNRWTNKKKRSIVFDGVWERQPKMLDTAKTYLQWLLLGKMGKKRVWGTARTYKGYLDIMATFLEKHNRTSFGELTPELMRRWWCGVEKTENDRAVIELMVRMCTCRGLPHLPKNPLQSLHLPTFVVLEKVKQTEAIDDVLWVKVLQRAIAYEEDAHCRSGVDAGEGLELSVAIERGIKGPRSLVQYVWEVRMAGVVLVLAFTGMRRVSWQPYGRGLSDASQRERPYWVIWGTVFKFFERENEPAGPAGEIGRRGYAMMAGLAEDSGCLFPDSFSDHVGVQILWWLKMQKFEDEPNCSHHPPTPIPPDARCVF
jgi:hypothetical protein